MGSKSSPQPNSGESDDRFAELLERVHDGLIGEADLAHPSSISSETVQNGDTSLAKDLVQAEQCLRLLEQVRRDQQQDDIQVPRIEELLTESTRNVGSFEIQRLLGQGSYGVVYLAMDQRLQRRIALKIPRPEVLLTPQLKDRFLQEGKAAAALNHPHIVPIYEAGKDGSVYYIASAYVDGGSLADLLNATDQPIAIATVAHWMSELADAVQHAHNRGVLHRDLKPSNVLLDGNQLVDGQKGDAVIRLTDFGLAKLQSDDFSRTGTGSVLGTPAYMSPEQACGGGEEIGPSTDVYSLGAIMYELLTGRPPFQGGALLDVLQAVRDQRPPKPRVFRQELPVDLEAICLKCLEKNPADRYGSANALSQDLERFLKREPVLARSIGGHIRVARWCKRNPVITALGAAIAVLTMAIAIGSTVTAIRLAKAGRETKQHLEKEQAALRRATRSEFDARIAQARAIRQTASASHRTESLKAISYAMQLAEKLEITPPTRLEIRNEAIAGLSLVDLEVANRWPVQIGSDNFLDTDTGCEHYVHPNPELTEALIRRLSDNKILQRLPFEEPCQRYLGFGFSPCDRYLAFLYQNDGQERIQLWDVRDGKGIGRVDVHSFGKSTAFSSDGNRIAISISNKRLIEIRSLPKLDLLGAIALPTEPACIEFHPTLPLLSVYRAVSTNRGRVDLCNTATGLVVRSVDWKSDIFSFAWNNDGTKLAAGCRDGVIRVLELESNEIQKGKIRIKKIPGHESIISKVAWHPNGRYVASSSLDGTTQIVSAETGDVLVTASGTLTKFSRQGNWLGMQGGRWKFVGNGEYVSYSQPESKITIEVGFAKQAGTTTQVTFWESHPQGQLVIGQNFFQAVFRDTAQDKPLATIPLDGGGFRFSPDGRWLYAISVHHGLSRLPVQWNSQADCLELNIGPPEFLHDFPPGTFAVNDQEVVVAPFLGKARIYDTNTHSIRTDFSPAHAMLFFCDLDVHGRFAATGSFKGHQVELRSPNDGRLVKSFPAGTCAVWFSPDGKILATVESGRYRFYSTKSWNLLKEMIAVSGGIFPGAISFSDCGKWLAIEDGVSAVLLETDTFSEIARFKIPIGQLIESIRIMPGATHLIVGGTDGSQTHIWDLYRIREQLAKLKLDWSPNVDIRNVDSTGMKPIRLNLDLGELATRTGKAKLDLLDKFYRHRPASSLSDSERLEVISKQMGKKQYSGAIQNLTIWIKTHAEDESLFEKYSQRGMCFARRAQTGDSARAMKDLQQALDLKPDFQNAADELLRLHLRDAREQSQAHLPVDRIHELLQIISSSDRAPLALTVAYAHCCLGRHETAKSDLQQLYQKAQLECPAPTLHLLAIIHHQRGDYESARRYFLAAEEWFALYYPRLQADTSFRIIEIARYARETIDSAMIADPRIPKFNPKLFRQLTSRWRSYSDAEHPMRRKLARSLISFKMHHAAIVESGFEIQLWPKSNSGYYWRGLAHIMLGEFDHAFRDFNVSLELKRDDAWCLNNLAWIYSMGTDQLNKDPELALTMAHEAIKLNPQHASMRITKATALLQLGRWKECQMAIRETRDKGSNNPLLDLLQARCDLELSNLTLARRAFNKGLLGIEKLAADKRIFADRLILEIQRKLVRLVQHTGLNSQAGGKQEKILP